MFALLVATCGADMKLPADTEMSFLDDFMDCHGCPPLSKICIRAIAHKCITNDDADMDCILDTMPPCFKGCKLEFGRMIECTGKMFTSLANLFEQQGSS